MPVLLVGEYSIEVETPGFAKFSQRPNVIGISEAFKLPIRLFPAEQRETVLVSTEAAAGKSMPAPNP